MLHIAPGSPCSLAHPRTAGLCCLVQGTKLSRYAPRRPHSTLPAQQQDQAVQCSRWISFFTILPSTRAHAAEKYYEISSQHAFSSVRKCARTLAHAQERPLFPSNHTISPLFLSLLPRHRPLTTPQTLPPTNPHRPLQAEEKKFSPHSQKKTRTRQEEQNAPSNPEEMRTRSSAHRAQRQQETSGATTPSSSCRLRAKLAATVFTVLLAGCASPNTDSTSRIPRDTNTSANRTPDSGNPYGITSRPDPTQDLARGTSGGSDPLKIVRPGNFVAGLTRGRNGGRDPLALAIEQGFQFTLNGAPSEIELASILLATVSTEYTATYTIFPPLILQSKVTNYNGRQSILTTYPDGSKSWTLHEILTPDLMQNIEPTAQCTRSSIGSWQCDTQDTKLPLIANSVLPIPLGSTLLAATGLMTAREAEQAQPGSVKTSKHTINKQPSTCIEWPRSAVAPQSIVLTGICLNQTGLPTYVRAEIRADLLPETSLLNKMEVFPESSLPDLLPDDASNSRTFSPFSREKWISISIGLTDQSPTASQSALEPPS